MSRSGNSADKSTERAPQQIATLICSQGNIHRELYTDEQLLWFTEGINDILRRQLGYSTPSEFFEAFIT